MRSNCRVRCVGKDNTVECLGNVSESGEFLATFLSKEYDEYLVGFGVFFGFFDGVQEGAWWQGLLVNPVNEVTLRSSSLVFHVFSVLEKLQSWKTLNSESG